MKKLTDQELKKIYDILCEHHKKYLKQYGVKLPKLTHKKGNYTKDALVLVYLSKSYPKTKSVLKGELTQFIRQFYPDVTDVQQQRHLAAQKGWYIISGTRGNRVVKLRSGEYQLITLEKAYPGFVRQKREEVKKEDWEKVKKKYGNRCATCGSLEGEVNIHWPSSITKLQKSHMNPKKSLVVKNTIPQCQFCNRAYRNYWVFNAKGRIRKLADPNVIKKSDKEVRWEVYKILYEEFRGVNANEQ